MSDLEEMDSESLNELESILYASIHYNDAFGEEQEQQKQQKTAMDADSQSMPPPPLQREHPQQQKRIVSNKRVINNAAPKARYWAATGNVAAAAGVPEPVQMESSSPTSAAVNDATEATEPSSSMQQSKRMSPPVKAQPKDKHKSQVKSSKKPEPVRKLPKALNSVQKLLQKQQQKKLQIEQKRNKQTQQQSQQPIKQKKIQEQKPPKLQQNSKAKDEDSEPERFDQRLLVALPQNWPPKRERARRDVGPFGKANRKLDQFQRLAEKRQKTKRVQESNKNKRPNKGQPELINLADSTNSSDNDDVIIVPLPPVPIIDVDASDEEKPQTPAQPYLEENAMDAADVNLGIEYPTEHELTPSALHSPCNSVLSSDDFIVQKDTSRLLAEHAKATDEDLLVLTEDAIKNAADPSPDNQEENMLELMTENSSDHEFVPPSRLEEIKQNYRVDEQQFRALDVYESESDLTESGIYCKAKHKAVPTIIRSIDSASDCSDIELVVETSVNKTKRLRKRRASSTNQSQSDPNNEANSNDTDSDDAAQATGVPGIARGMAVERCKRKIRRISQRRSSESAVPAPPPKAPVDDASSDSPLDEALPTARQIAERLLNQEQAKEPTQVETVKADNDDEEMGSIGTDANTEDEAEMQDAMTERISAVFKRIDGKVRADQHEHNKQQLEVSTIEQEEPLETIDEENNQSIEKSDLEPLSEEELAPKADVVIQVEHNTTELKEQLHGGDLVGWNDEMCRFYNDSWNGEHFNLYKIQKAMNGHHSEWKIIAADRYPVARKRSHLKCSNCLEMGHIRAKCTRPRKPIVCSTCGMPGHAEPRCPNAICLGCGAKQTTYVQRCNKCSFFSRMICQLCKMRGHSTEMCPDKWRRYHSTTRTNVPLESKVQFRPKHCSYCAARGHLFEECRQRIGEYRYNNYTTQIISYQKVYKDRAGPISYLSDLSSFFNIDTPFHFKWSSEFVKNSSYARFLKAVGLARLPAKSKKYTVPAIALPKMIYTNNYVPNPHATMARRTKGTSVIIKELPVENKAESTATVTSATVVKTSAAMQIQQKEISSNFQNMPREAKTNAQPSCTVVSKSTVTPHDLDSDSNYSFSEHFEVSSSTTNAPCNEQISITSSSGPMDNLPDVIPLSIGNDEYKEEDINTSSNNQGISMCVNSQNAEVCSGPDELPDIPCEAKIVIPHDQATYLFSPEGRQFLTDSSKQCNVDVRIDFKEYGIVLVIYGLKQNQVNLQLLLLQRSQQVKRKTIEFQSQKPPKRIDVLIRFMRDGIYSLTGDLGNAKSLYFRIKELESMNTKNGFKMAERKRRLLNMILFGQAGLGTGTMHLDQLLIILRRLLDNQLTEENATAALRSEIEEHWRVIFSAYPHPNYESLLQSYSKLDVKNRMKSLNVEIMLLEQQNTRKPQILPSATVQHEEKAPPAPSMQQQQQNAHGNNRQAKQRVLPNIRSPGQQQLQESPPPVWQNIESASPSQSFIHQQQQQQQQQQQINHGKLKQRSMTHSRMAGQRHRKLPPPPLWQHEQSIGMQHHQQQYNNNVNKNRPQKQRSLPYAQTQNQQQQQQMMPPSNRLQRMSGRLQLSDRRPLQSECVKLLADMERGPSSRINTDASKPSIFWSRESLKYLDKLFKLTNNSETILRLNRVLERSRQGQLSHNDYRAVIRLHSMMDSN